MNRPKKLIIIVFGLPPGHVGGTEYQTINLARRLSKQINVELIARKHPKYDNTEESDHFKITELKCINIKILLGISFFIKLFFYLFKNRDYDMTLIMNSNHFSLLFFFQKLLFKKKYIVWTRHTKEFTNLSLIKRTIKKKIFTESECVIVQSPNLIPLFEQNFPKINVVSIPNGVDENTKIKFYMRQRNILFVGRLTEQKNIDLLINFAKKHKEYNLSICGSGPEEIRLKSLSANSKNITFYGRVKHEELLKIYKKHSVFVLPSNSEGLANVLLEAMSVGMPVISTSVGGISSLITNKKNGILIDPTEQSLNEALLWLFRDEKRYQNISLNAYKTSKKYNWETVIKQFNSLLKKSMTNYNYQSLRRTRP